MVVPDVNQKKLGPSIVITSQEDIDKSPVMQLHIKRYELTKTLIHTRMNIILDVGCGTGYGCQMLKEISDKVVGVDVNTEVIKYALDHYPDCKFYEGEIYGFSSSSVDVVVCHVVFGGGDMTEEMFRFCKDALRVLKPNGLLIGSNSGIMQVARQVFNNLEEYSIEGFEEYTGSVVFKCVKEK